jgi:hypothetical protein
MITNYNKFLYNKLNEGLWDSIKNLFGKLLQNVSDELKKPVNELTNKLSKTKDTKQIKNIIYNYLKVHNTTLTNSLKNINDIPHLKKLMMENLKVIYASITAQVQSLGEENYSFSEIFADSPPRMKELFDKNEKQFNKKLEGYVNNLITLQAKPFGYTPEVLKTELEKPIQESFKLKKFNQLFEKEGDVVPQTDTTIDNKDATEKEQIKNPQESKKEVKNENFEKLKSAIKKWFDLSIYKKMNDTLKKEKDAGTTSGTVEDKIKNMTSTENKESVNKIVDALTKTDKEKLKTVRDTVGLNKDSAPL